MTTSTATDTWAERPDLSDIGFWTLPIAERAAAFAALRERDPVPFFPEPDIGLPRGPGFYALTRYDDVVAASRNPAVFTSGKNADAAREAGADIVGMEDLAAQVKAGNINFDRVIASPDAMRVVGQLGQILGPRGLMPNPKVGTVTPDVATAVKNAKAGQVTYRVDKAGIIHCIIGKSKFEAAHLKDNLLALINDLNKAKPATSKGIYLKRITLSSTMGPGVVIDQQSLGLKL